ncbi:MAG: GntR family transcriptional regulator [Burkholderiales bacterium]
MDLKVAPVTVQEQTANKLRDAILSGYFKPGERLIEAGLCSLMSVSRTSIREALRRLEAEKLIVIVPNKGPSVAEISWDEAEEIYRVRAMLEGEAAALFAQRATTANKNEMRKALESFSRAAQGDDAMGRIAATNRFYEVMLAGCGNRIISELLTGLVARVNFLRARSMSQPGRTRHSTTELRRILTAIERKDVAAARTAAVEHVLAACAVARESFFVRKAA